MRITRSASSNTNAKQVVAQEDDNNDAPPPAAPPDLTIDDIVASASSIFPGGEGTAKALDKGDAETIAFVDIICEANGLYVGKVNCNQLRMNWIVNKLREIFGKFACISEGRNGVGLKFYQATTRCKNSEVIQLSVDRVTEEGGALFNYIERHASKAIIKSLGVTQIVRSQTILRELPTKNPDVHRKVQIILGHEVVATPPNPPNKSEEGSVHDDEEDVHRTDEEEDNGMDNSEDEVNNNKDPPSDDEEDEIIINGPDKDAVGGLASDATPNSPPTYEGGDFVNPKSPDGVDLDNMSGSDDEDDGPPLLPNIPPRSPTKNIVKKENKETVKVEEKQKQDGRPSFDPVIHMVSVFGRDDSSHSVHNLSYLSTLLP